MSIKNLTRLLKFSKYYAKKKFILKEFIIEKSQVNIIQKNIF